MGAATPRFYVRQMLRTDETVTFAPAQAAQMARVLRLRPGEMVEVFDGHGASATVELQTLDAKHAIGVARAVQTHAWPLALRPVLGLALIRPQRFEWAIEKAVELGAWAVQPLLTTRTQHGGAATGATKQARWQAIAIEAAEQCGSAFLPEIRPPLRLADALTLPAALRLVAHTDPELPRMTVAEALAGARPPDGAEVALYIGPEGGLTPEEVAQALAAGCHAVTLGPLTLRSETAALAALTLIGAAAAGPAAGAPNLVPLP